MAAEVWFPDHQVMGGSRVSGVDAGLSTENWDALQQRLAKLSEQECTVVLMRLFESVPQSEIAERLGITRTHVYRLLATSLARLRD